MSKILFINSVCDGSTGTICKNLYKEAEKNGHNCCIAYGRGIAPVGFKTIKIGNKLDMYIHILKSRIFDNSGFNSKNITKKFIKEIEDFGPDIIYMHNLHGYYLNVEILFDYLKKQKNIKKIWTLHDCWAFTGHCTHFTVEGCYKWKINCKQCKLKKEYPKCYILDNSYSNFKKKKECFSNVENLQIITPSIWLAKLVKESFLSSYSIKVQYNEIDDIFIPTDNDIKNQMKLSNKYLLLGVSSIWNDKKGFSDFKLLAEKLDERFIIILIGLKQKQIKKLPKNIIGIEKLENKVELAKYYTAADIYINLSKEETFGMTTVEALSCGTKVIVYKNTACEEIANLYGGSIVSQDIDNVFYEIYNLLNLIGEK